MVSSLITINDIIKILEINNIKKEVKDIHFIDQGGQKSVFKCNIDGEVYALKFCDVTNIESEATDVSDKSEIENAKLSRARREIEIMNKVNCPYLVKLGPIGLNVTQYNNKTILFFSEEYIPGNDLSKVILNERLSLENTIQMALNLAKAIQQLWNIKMVHRDIKPKNIMMKENGEFVLLDTGIAFDVQGEALTAEFNIVGTKIYMSPEQLNGYRRELDFRSDLFLLGITMYEASTGKHPFYESGFETSKILTNIILNQVTPPSKIIEGYPKNLERIIMRLLSKEPHLRYKSCDQLIKQLTLLKENEY